MKYPDLRNLKKIFEGGGNITSYLKKVDSIKVNTVKSIEIAYDLQSGSYIKYCLSNREYWETYTSEIGEIIKPYLKTGDRILDCGTGEMTTLAGIADKSFPQKVHTYAFDISLSRILFGKKFVQKHTNAAFYKNLYAFVASLTAIPLLNNSMNVVLTSHALEPNHGREEEILHEIFRVASRKVLLFEPSYENNTKDGRKRMEQLGYVRNLPEFIQKLGGKIEQIIPLKNVSNNMNPTHAYIIEPPKFKERTNLNDIFACPASNTPLVTSRDDCYYSEESMLVYPKISGVPILRKDVAVVSFYPEMF